MCLDSCITQLKAQGPSRTCNESKEEEEEVSCTNASTCGVSQSDSGRARGTRARAVPQERGCHFPGDGGVRNSVSFL